MVVSDSAFEVNEPMVISETIDGETIIINLVSGNYYSLKHSGAMIWTVIQQAGTLSDIAATIGAHFEGDEHDIEHEISALVESLLAEGLIRRKEGGAASFSPSVASAGQERIPFLAPLLDKFTDMEAMLLLDPVHDVDDAGWPHVRANGDQVNA
jgi:hypothetical protein